MMAIIFWYALKQKQLDSSILFLNVYIIKETISKVSSIFELSRETFLCHKQVASEFGIKFPIHVVSLAFFFLFNIETNPLLSFAYPNGLWLIKWLISATDVKICQKGKILFETQRIAASEGKNAGTNERCDNYRTKENL